MAPLVDVIQQNQQTVADLVARARAIPADKWTVPRAPGKWSPAQVIEHVTKSYEGHRAMCQGKVAGGSAFKQWAFRTLFLPRLFKAGDFTQKGLKSPKFIVPSDVPASAAELLPRLEAASNGLEQDLHAAVAAGRTTIRTSLFGPLSPADLLLFVVIHTRHHAPQVTAGN